MSMFRGQNSECCGSGPCHPGEVRFMATSKDRWQGGLILCKYCWERELVWRRRRNQGLAEDCAFDLPAWKDATIYLGAA